MFHKSQESFLFPGVGLCLPRFFFAILCPNLVIREPVPSRTSMSSGAGLGCLGRLEAERSPPPPSQNRVAIGPPPPRCCCSVGETSASPKLRVHFQPFESLSGGKENKAFYGFKGFLHDFWAPEENRACSALKDDTTTCCTLCGAISSGEGEARVRRYFETVAGCFPQERMRLEMEERRRRREHEQMTRRAQQVAAQTSPFGFWCLQCSLFPLGRTSRRCEALKV